MIDSMGLDCIPEFGISSIPNMGNQLSQTRARMRPRDILKSNLRALMSARPDLDTIVKVSSASGISKGVVERMTKAEANAGIDHLAGLAQAFGVEPADLLRDTPPSDAVPSVQQPLEQALRALAAAARAHPEDVRARTSELVALVVAHPDAHADHQIPIIERLLSGNESSDSSRRRAANE